MRFLGEIRPAHRVNIAGNFPLTVSVGQGEVRDGSKFIGYPGRDHRQGGEDFFSNKNRGAQTFFRKKLGGRRLFFEKN